MSKILHVQRSVLQGSDAVKYSAVQWSTGQVVSVWYTLLSVIHENCLPYAVYFGILLGSKFTFEG